MQRYLLFALALCAPLFAQGLPQKAARPSPRERWEHMAPEQRRDLEQRFQKWQRLPPDERERMADRMRDLEQRIDARLERLSSEENGKLTGLAPEERRAVVRELVLSELRERGQTLRAKLPPEWLDKLERAGPCERRPLFEQFRHGVREHGGRGAILALGRELDLPEAEVQRLLALPGEQQMPAIDRLRRVQIERRVAEHGLPAQLDAETYALLGALPDREFLREWERRRPEPFEGGRRGGERWGGERPPRGGPEGGPRRFGARGPERFGPEDTDCRPRLDDLIEFRHMPPAERQRALGERMRTRALERLELRGLAPERLEALRKLQGPEFFRALRELERGERGERTEHGERDEPGAGGERTERGSRGERSEHDAGGELR